MLPHVAAIAALERIALSEEEPVDRTCCATASNGAGYCLLSAGIGFAAQRLVDADLPLEREPSPPILPYGKQRRHRLRRASCPYASRCSKKTWAWLGFVLRVGGQHIEQRLSFPVRIMMVGKRCK